jgi:putative sterol carrier protein
LVDATAEFFDDLGRRGSVPVLGMTSGTVRFDLRAGRRTEHWLVELRRGTVAVSRANGPADCVIAADRKGFDEVASGRLNALAAALRGVLAIEGDPALLVRFQRLFPYAEVRPTTASARTVGRQRS